MNRLIQLFRIFFFSILAQLICSPASHAAVANDWKAGNIIADGIFFNSQSMSVEQIQSFLNSKVPTCDVNGTKIYSGSTTRGEYGTSQGNPPPYTCLRDYTQDTQGRSQESGLCNNYVGGIKSAAQIIKDVSNACGINPQVLLILLQKEQTLVTDDWPWQIQYKAATGFGCPDTASCDSNYGGFFNQVYMAARQYRLYARDSDLYTHLAYRNNNVRYSPNVACGSSTVYIDSQATAGLYNYTPYQPNQSALNNLYGSGDSCSSYGNRNFWRLFVDWFGNTRLPTVFKTPNSSSIYVQAVGYKFYVPTMDILRDWGLPTGAQEISQSVSDSIPSGSPAVGLSDSIGTIVKSSSDSDTDGGNIYIVTAGKRYLFTTWQQVLDFGFTAADIHFLPLNFIMLINDGGTLNNYVKATDTYSYFYSNGKRSLLPEGPAYAEKNNLGYPSLINSSVLGRTPATTPLSDREILFRKTDGTIYLYRGGLYFYVPTAEVLGCWGFDQTLATQKVWLAYDSAIGDVSNTANLGCGVGIDGVQYILNGINKILVPPEYGFSLPVIDSALRDVLGRLPLREKPIGRTVKAALSPSVWYLENGTKRGIPSLVDLKLLGYDIPSIELLGGGVIDELGVDGVKFGVGQVVRESETGNVYVITSPATKRWVTTPDQFIAYRYSWSGLAGFSKSLIDKHYPTETQSKLSNYLYTDSGGIYLIDSNRCYGVNQSQISAYGIPSTKIDAGQTYSNTIFYNLNLITCTYASIYIKGVSSGTVFVLEGGTKRPISSWLKLVQLSGSPNPYIITVSNSSLSSFPTGSVY